ncbi:MAG TPA: Mrp/NBP35 family ATP-binding protein [Hyphomonas sp.]|nr:Mrp/NBP35 family ATP-binding protein [Hyphomonas sp.]HRX37680.1 Mrp/NBP35 family ATP-binding protein [Aestuariivirga sp.]
MKPPEREEKGGGWDAARIRRALRSVTDPVSGQNIADNGCVRAVIVPAPGQVTIELEPDKVREGDRESLRTATAKAVQSVGGISQVQVRYAGEPEETGLRLERSVPAAAPAHSHSHETGPRPMRPEGVRYILAVSSAKGGVGKSTVAVNLARALAQRGRRVGLLDADVYGPSVPTMIGKTGALADVGPSERIMPIDVHGIRVMSMGFIIPEGKAVAWRGPMVMNALVQMLSGVDWGELDYLLLDLPPGTGDVQLTLVQQASVDGAVIVSTPQEVALADVRRGVEFFARTQVPVLGVIENMSFLKDAATGLEVDLFGRGGARTEAGKLGVPFIGEVPFDVGLRKASDAGDQLTGAIGRIFGVLAELVEESAVAQNR